MLPEQLEEPTLAELLLRTLKRAARDHGPATFSSSLSAEDMVVTDAILTAGLDIPIFTIDTGRLNAETLDVVDAIRHRYGYQVRVYAPEADAVAYFEALNGRDAFYRSPALRRECCHVRKVEPLKRALFGKKAWITGLRRDSAATRGALPLFQYDAGFDVLKFNPLAQWSEADVWAYLRERDVPYNALYDRGFRSIGCAPCTRATAAGEDVRAGRWWWETDSVKECGLHVAADGQLARAKALA